MDIVEDIHSILASSKHLRCDSLFNACLHANEEIINFLVERNPEDVYENSIRAFMTGRKEIPETLISVKIDLLTYS